MRHHVRGRDVALQRLYGCGIIKSKPMFKKITHFIKYNNAAVLILAFFLLFGAGAFAQSPAGQEFIGEKQVRMEGVDNALLLDADLDNFDMDFKIERIEDDGVYYYITYTYLDLVKNNNVWEYRIFEKTRKTTIARINDLGMHIAEELGQQYDARMKELRIEQEKALGAGPEIRKEVLEYSGLIGKTLDLAGRVWPGYDPVKITEVPSPEPSALFSLKEANDEIQGRSDDLTQIYLDYIAEKDPFGELAGVDSGDGDSAEKDGGGEEYLKEEKDAGGTEEVFDVEGGEDGEEDFEEEVVEIVELEGN
jgi:hypothetical protein